MAGANDRQQPPFAPNLLKRNVNTATTNQTWLADITDIETDHGSALPRRRRHRRGHGETSKRPSLQACNGWTVQQLRLLQPIGNIPADGAEQRYLANAGGMRDSDITRTKQPLANSTRFFTNRSDDLTADAVFSASPLRDSSEPERARLPALRRQHWTGTSQTICVTVPKPV
jgi:hypothetical protein